MKKYLKLVLGIMISVFFLWMVFRNVDLGNVLKIIKNTNIWLISGSIAISVAALALRSLRWKMLGRDYSGVKWIHFFKATSIGLMMNTFLPFRAGDLFQGYFISKNSNLSKSYALATVFMERISDFVPYAMVLVIGSFLVALPSVISIKRLGFIFGTVFLVIALAIFFRHRIIAMFGRFVHEKHSAKITKLLENFFGALSFIKDRQFITKAVPLTLVFWFVNMTATLLVMRSIGINLSFPQVILAQAITVMSVAIPSSPGYVGTWEFFCVLALSIFGVSSEVALSFALLSHFLAFLPTTVFGLIFFAEETISSKKIKQQI